MISGLIGGTLGGMYGYYFMDRYYPHSDYKIVGVLAGGFWGFIVGSQFSPDGRRVMTEAEFRIWWKNKRAGSARI